jgi:hypothetical protein
MGNVEVVWRWYICLYNWMYEYTIRCLGTQFDICKYSGMFQYKIGCL